VVFTWRAVRAGIGLIPAGFAGFFSGQDAVLECKLLELAGIDGSSPFISRTSSSWKAKGMQFATHLLR